MTMSEPEGKLDAEALAEANGPADEPLDWDAIDWRAVEKDVRRLRQRIFTASQAGDHKKVRNLQKLMLRSRANTLVSVRRVTEDNAGRKTAGIGGRVIHIAVPARLVTSGRCTRLRLPTRWPWADHIATALEVIGRLHLAPG